MSKKRTPSAKGRRSRQKSKPSRLGRFLRWLFKLGLVLTVIAAAGLVYLDAQVRSKFEGKRWAVPAKVYARPLELYPGQSIAMDELKQELKTLNYRFVRRADQPGAVEWASSRARIYSRGFDFPDEVEPSRNMLLSFSGGRLQSIKSSDGRSLPLVRLEPMLIGGIYPKSNEDRDLIKLEEAPPHLAQALVTVEDRAFYDHWGVSPKGIARAMWVNIREGRFVQGGSTLTQQLIKNFYLTSDRTLSRKLLELPMAMLLELHYDKDEILEAYLNEVYLGQSGSRSIHGFGLASQYYFARPVQELELHQVALLAGMVKGPSWYDPRRNPDRAMERRNLVLKMLFEQGHISRDEYDQARRQTLGVVKQRSLHKGAFPAYLDLVKRKLREEYRDEDLSSEGLRVFTSLDPLVQTRAEAALETGIGRLEKRYGKRAKELEASMVVTDPQTGEVMALIGGRDNRYTGFNRALDALRPIGSLVKPAVYLAALEQGYTLATPLEDEPLSVKMPDGSVWQPQNFDRRSHGVIPLHRSLALSYNQSTARLGMNVGLDNVIDMLHRLGAERDLKAYPSLLLGAQALSPLELASVYQTIAANGFRMPLRVIRRVTDAEGEELSRYPFTLKQQVKPELVHLLQYALQEVAREGTARSVYSVLPDNLNVGGKTGTSNDQRDSWFAGFAGDRLAVVWLGRDDNSQLPFTGSGGALRVWTEFMRRESPEPFLATRPAGVEYVWIDEATGLRSDRRCEGSRQLPFLTGTAPSEKVDCGLDNPVRRSLDWFRNWFD
ncbi:penicillin-binding protein 1B [Marinobacterium stanieri]|uniref:Penicillin-binding protein 1B n=1 Tax=Marinobacterium stanieri TaxID=49186 RepID=A0A1N6XQ48_9GAMM|nr:penicillin-binding protein 1B [Marinobacterium stanieri]SIR04442.1 penicillin-binding protein 1B [Marinobacterium stanieri]